ncbi:hypothetical protein KUCAC02_031967 [Chaenocephalus aceratus]|nr:hypothetical protein KUCAC02_031967 [Chaenocephalus aceratus]
MEDGKKVKNNKMMRIVKGKRERSKLKNTKKGNGEREEIIGENPKKKKKSWVITPKARDTMNDGNAKRRRRMREDNVKRHGKKGKDNKRMGIEVEKLKYAQQKGNTGRVESVGENQKGQEQFRDML